MWKLPPQTKTRLAFLSVALLSMLLVLAAGWRTAQADDNEWLGRIESIPDGGQSGDWVVRGRTFVADEETEFHTEHGPLVMNACVEVEFAGSDPTRAQSITTKSDDDCGSNVAPSESPTVDETAPPDESATPDATAPADATPSATPTADDGGDHDGGDDGHDGGHEGDDDADHDGGDDSGDHAQEARGTVDSMPDEGLVGDWVVEGVTYSADENTEFRQHDGPLMAGACVEVKFSGAAEPFTLEEIETEDGEDCTNPPTPDETGQPAETATPDDSATPTATPAPTSDPLQHIGRVDSLPTDLIGDWVIEGVTYTADDATEFHPDHGDFAENACVKVHTTTAEAPFTISSIETIQAFYCSSEDDGEHGAEGEIFGLIQSFPNDLIGPWNVGGMTFQADDQTEFNQEHGAFAVDALVKVHFVVGSDGLNYAREIESVYHSDDEGNDDDGNGSFDGAEGHAYGPIGSFPADLVGEWIVAGVTYTATQETRFDQEDGAFAEGVRVKVEYHLDAQRQRIAQKIEVTNDDGGAAAADHFTLFGSVSRMPPNGFLGAWQVDGVDFQAEAGAEFNEENGLLGLGAYVKVEYTVQDGVNQIVEIETHVPPGAGANTAVGVIDDMGGALQAAGVQATSWTIGGVNYAITPATDLNDVGGALVVGNTVVVNSYTASDGSQVATQVRGVTFDQKILLPLVSQ